MSAELWERYAPEVRDGLEPDEIDAIEEGSAKGSAHCAKVLRYRALYIYGAAIDLASCYDYDASTDEDWSHRMMRRAARLGDQYAILWCAELFAMQGRVEKAMAYLAAKHRASGEEGLDLIVEGLLAGWSWRVHRNVSGGRLAVRLYRTTVPELIGDAASYLEASGRTQEAVELYANENERDSYAKFYFANWLFERGDLEAAREQVSELAAEYPEPALLLGKISLAEGDASSAHYWAGDAASYGVPGARRLARIAGRRARLRPGFASPA